MTTLSLGKSASLAGPRVRGALNDLLVFAEATIGGARMTENLRAIEQSVRYAVLFTSDNPRLDSRAWKMLHEALQTLDELRERPDFPEKDRRVFEWGAVCAHLLVIARRDRAALDDILAEDFREEFGSNPE